MATNALDLENLSSTRKRKAPDRLDPSLANSVVTTHDVSSSDPDDVANAKKRLKQASESALFNAEPSLRISGEICLIETARMMPRSKFEVWNYAYLTNQYLNGKRKKIKSTQTRHNQQRDFCNAVRSMNKELFDDLNDGKLPKDKMFSVVGHVPDQAISGAHGAQACCDSSGMYQVPGWLPMTRQANALVANLAKQTGCHVSELRVDGQKPNCLIKPNQY